MGCGFGTGSHTGQREERAGGDHERPLYVLRITHFAEIRLKFEKESDDNADVTLLACLLSREPQDKIEKTESAIEVALRKSGSGATVGCCSASDPLVDTGP